MSDSNEIENLSDAQVLEVSRSVLPDLLDVADEIHAEEKVIAELGIPEDELINFRASMKQSAEGFSDDTVGLLRAILLGLWETEYRAGIETAIQDSSKRQTIAGVELLVLGALFGALYIVIAKKGKIEEIETTTTEKKPDGAIVVTVKTEKKYLNPLNPLSGIIGKLIGK
ncbi:hypothetical protein [Ruegeria denitrificans]|uniref:hypothetical protein n=1 Tax=Ruegeria denitrificans TaxID=1715692 RepID=UPI003C7A100B